MFELIPNLSWLPWYLNLLIAFPIALFVIYSLFRLAILLVELIRTIKGIFFV